jgi:hypothetical protein
VQVDPIKPMLKAPGIEPLKLKCDKPLSNFTFKFNLRRYNEQAPDEYYVLPHSSGWAILVGPNRYDLPRHRHLTHFWTLDYWVKWHPVTRRAMYARPCIVETVEGGLHERGDLVGWCRLTL